MPGVPVPQTADEAASHLAEALARSLSLASAPPTYYSRAAARGRAATGRSTSTSSSATGAQASQPPRDRPASPTLGDWELIGGAAPPTDTPIVSPRVILSRGQYATRVVSPAALPRGRAYAVWDTVLFDCLFGVVVAHEPGAFARLCAFLPEQR